MRQTILVIEDDHALRDVLMRGLRDDDPDPVPAPDGATALRLATPRHLRRRPSTSGCPTPTGGTCARRCARTDSSPPSSS